MTVPTIEGYLSGTPVTIATNANLQNLSSGSSIVCSVFSNVQGDGAGGGFPNGSAKLHIDSSMAVSAGGNISVWFLRASDGSTYEQGSSSVTPTRAADIIFAPVQQTAVIDIEMPCWIPICATQKALVQNNLGASIPNGVVSSYIKIYPETQQAIQV